jgi:plastocyanin
LKHHDLGAAVLISIAASLGSAAHAVAATVNINITAGLKFDPAVVAINAGDEVVWTNTAGIAHDTVSGDPSDPNPGQLWDSPLLFPGDSFSRTFQAGETTDFFCSVHPTRIFGRVFVNGTGVQCTMIPANTTVTAQKITFDIWLLNFTGGSQSVNGQVKVEDPGGTSHTVLNKNGTLGPMAQLRVPFTITLPGGAPVGDYVVTLELRNSQGILISSDQDTYNKFSLESEAAASPATVTGEGSLPGWEPSQP